LQDLGAIHKAPTNLLIDNQSAIKIVKNPVFHKKMKHVDTKYHFIRTLINKNIIKLEYYPSKDQTSNIFTKPLEKIKFTNFRDELGICKNKLHD
jgi:hypothetical protein